MVAEWMLTSSCSGVGATSSSGSSSRIVSDAKPVADDDAASPVGLHDTTLLLGCSAMQQLQSVQVPLKIQVTLQC